MVTELAAQTGRVSIMEPIVIDGLKGEVFFAEAKDNFSTQQRLAGKDIFLLLIWRLMRAYQISAFLLTRMTAMTIIRRPTTMRDLPQQSKTLLHHSAF